MYSWTWRSSEQKEEKKILKIRQSFEDVKLRGKKNSIDPDPCSRLIKKRPPVAM